MTRICDDMDSATATAAAPRYWALIVAAGVGSRMAAKLPKQYMTLAGQAVIEHSLYCFGQHPSIAGIVVVLKENDEHWARLNFKTDKPLITAVGGAERADSVLSGLLALLGNTPDEANGNDWVLVHDAARPCLTPAELGRLIVEVGDHAVGGILGLPARDTLKQVEHGVVCNTLDRAQVWHAQTPQMFRLGLLREALESALGSGVAVTDESMAMERLAQLPRVVEGNPSNIKLTTAEDLPLAEFILSRHNRG